MRGVWIWTVGVWVWGMASIVMAGTATLTMPELEGWVGETIALPVEVTTADTIGIAQFVVEYDSLVLTFDHAEIGGGATGFVVSNVNTNLPFDPVAPGANENVLVQISGEGSQYFTGENVEATVLYFVVVGSERQSSPLAFDRGGDRTNLTTKDLQTIAGADITFEDGSFTVEDRPPAAPTGLMAFAGDGQVDLQWNANTELDLHAYYVYRDTLSPATTLLDSVVAESPPDTVYVDMNVVNGTTYYYRMTAVDSARNESAFSDEVSATPMNPPPVIASVRPDSGWMEGGMEVVILGSNFGTQVSFGDSVATMVYDSSDSLVVLTPPHPAGVVDVVVINFDGQSDTLENGYTYVVPPTITVVSPNGGEEWLVGSEQEITWTSTGTIPNVKIEYSTNEGLYWTPIVASTPNDGSYTWTIPNTPSTDCLVKISDAEDGDPWDVSDGTFEIQQGEIHITRPSGGETWMLGDTETIRWSGGTGVAIVKIELLDSNSGRTRKIISGRTPNDGAFDWTLTSRLYPWLKPSDHCVVRISDAYDGDPWDVSGVFAIQQPKFVPESFALGQNAPNPFNPVTTIAYDLPEACEVTLSIYAITGQQVTTFVSGHQEAGHYEVIWDTGGLGAGIYFYRLEAGGFVETKRMALIK